LKYCTLNQRNMNSLTKITHWTPRILCILAILLISMFALDAFEPGRTIWQQLLAFIIHLIPSFILIAVLIVAWKWEKTGGIIFIIIGTALGIFLFRGNYRHNHNLWNSITIVMAMAFPFVLSGVLFILSHYLKNRDLKEAENIVPD
jgi:cell division protein FtsW (lipid II flippase)